MLYLAFSIMKLPLQGKLRQNTLLLLMEGQKAEKDS